MTTRFARVFCDRCDTTSKLELHEVTLMPELRSYRFICPCCETRIVRLAHPSVVYMLLDYADAIIVEHVTPPAIDVVSGPPIAAGEWVEAHENLDAWIDIQLGSHP
jgi:hypothetical protein